MTVLTLLAILYILAALARPRTRTIYRPTQPPKNPVPPGLRPPLNREE